MIAMLLAAGLGTRLKPFTDKHPKALAEVGGQTLLERNIRYLQRYSIFDVIVNVHHFADQIEQKLRDSDGFGSRVRVSDERAEVLETGGGVQRALALMGDAREVLVINTDVLTDLRLDRLLEAYAASEPDALLAVMERESSRRLLFDEGMRLSGWRNLQTGAVRAVPGRAGDRPFAFSGIQVLSTRFIRSWTRQGKFSLIDAYLEAGPERRIQGFDHTGDTFLDVGKPPQIEAAERWLERSGS